MDKAIVNIVIYLSCFGFMVALFNPFYPIITIASLSWFTGGTILVAVACATAGGIACIGGIGLYTLTTFTTTYFFTTITWIETLILTPISLLMILYIAKVARGH